MKNIYRIVTTILVLATAWSCSESDNMDPVGNWEIHPPTLSNPSNNATITLDEAAPTDKVRFDWQAAIATNKFIISYKVALLPQNSDDVNDALITFTPTNGGRDVFATPTAADIDYALWTACYPAGATVNLKWAVISKAIDKQTVTMQNVSIKRFNTEYYPTSLFISGAATEAGEDVTKATPMRARKNADGNLTNVFDVYTTLTKGATYHFRSAANTYAKKFGGSDGNLTCGSTIDAPETGQYRVTVDLNTNTYSLLKIDRWSMVGDAVEGGWGGDVPLTYKGNSVWESKVELFLPYNDAGFIFRANGDWGYLLKRIVGTATPDNKGGKLVMESEAASQGVTFQDIPGTTGVHTVTLNLAADAYTYTLVPDQTPVVVETIIGKTANPNADAVTGNFPIGNYDVPSELYLVSDGSAVATLTLDGSVYHSVKYIPLQASKKYILNDKQDGSGTTYNSYGNGELSVDHDQAYQLNIDFGTGKLSWKHYNMKLFHWDEVGGGWDQRQELLMTYIHPLKYEVTGNLHAGYHSKFNSPWDVQFGTASTALTGTMTNGGPNFTGINADGTYKASITVADDYSTADYAFVKQ